MTCLHGKTLGVRIIVAPTVYEVDINGKDYGKIEESYTICGTTVFV